MNRLTIVPIASLMALHFGCSTEEKTEKPNVILVLIDDQGYADFGYKGIHQNVKTPNLDIFASESMEFTQGYVSSPICSATRVGIISGQYQQRNGNYFYGGPGISDAPTMAEQFKKLGYSTGYIGKLHHGNNDGPDDRGNPNNHGFDHSITAFPGGTVHYLYHNYEAVEKHGIWASHWLINQEIVEQDGFTTEMISDWSQEYIEESRETPFFLYLSFNAVHNFTFQLPEEYLEEWGLPYYPDYEELDTDETRREWYARSIIPDLPYGREYYLAQLYYFDREFGKIRQKLKDLGIDDNTMIVYLSDNGGSNCSGGDNTPLYSTKYSLYEGGIRVPFFIHWPAQIQGGITKNGMVSSLDIMPTVLAAVGAPEDFYQQCDGLNLLPYLKNDIQPERDILYWDVTHSWAVRKGEWKLKEVVDQQWADRVSRRQNTDLGSGLELFNLENDIGEQHNLADGHPEIVEELQLLYANWKELMIQQ